jgi:hypothetical protein
MHDMRRTALALLTAALVATPLAACGGDRPTGTVSDDRSPLDALFGSLDQTDLQRRTEERVAVCMREKGWQYTPNLAATVRIEAPDPSDATFRARYGYGIVENLAMDAPTTPAAADPNAAYLASLSEAERSRYQEDLVGTLDETEGQESVSLGGPAGCIGTAFTEAATQTAGDPKILERLTALNDQITNDPRMVAATEKWSACMRNAGFTYRTPEAIFEDLLTRVSEARGIGAPEPIKTTEVDPAPPTTTAEAGAELAALGREEVAIAKADHECQAAGLAQVRRTIEAEVVQQLTTEFPDLGKGE